jgi:hypothetical protein
MVVKPFIAVPFARLGRVEKPGRAAAVVVMACPNAILGKNVVVLLPEIAPCGSSACLRWRSYRKPRQHLVAAVVDQVGRPSCALRGR